MIARNNNHLTKNVVRYVNFLQKIKFYWNSIKTELEATIMNIEFSNFFFTLNVVDMQWNDLYAHIFKFLKKKHEKVINEFVKTIIAYRFLQKNSHIITKYLNIHFQIFFNEILKKKFSILNHWYHFEWQNRNSDHIHEFLWIKNVFINDQR